MSEIEIIAHRVNCLEGLKTLFEAGIKSFELDVFGSSAFGVAVGYPKHANMDGYKPESLESILTWVGSEKEIKLYLDIKYPDYWRTSIEILFGRLLSFDRERLILISYDLQFFKALAENFCFRTGLIVDEPTGFWSGLVLIPLSIVTGLNVKQRQIKNIIATRVNTRMDFKVAKELSCLGIMTDKPIELLNYELGGEANGCWQ